MLLVLPNLDFPTSIHKMRRTHSSASPAALLVLIDTVDDHRSIVRRTPRRILPCTGAGHDIIREVAVVGCEERRNGAIEETLE